MGRIRQRGFLLSHPSTSGVISTTWGLFDSSILRYRPCTRGISKRDGMMVVVPLLASSVCYAAETLGEWMSESRNDALLVGPEGAALWPTVFLRPSDWNVHVPLAMWLVDSARPLSVLEVPLGDGQIFMAICDAVDRLRLGTSVTAVSLQHHIDAKLRRAHEASFGRFSQIRMTSLTGILEATDDGSIDLLHMTAASELATLADVEPWLAKLSDRGVLLVDGPSSGLHESGLWIGLSARYPTFEFHAGTGLGVVSVGENAEENVKRLTQSDDAGFAELVRSYFGRLGESVVARGEVQLLYDSATEAEAQLDRLAAERSDLLIEQARLREELHVQAAGGRREIGSARRKLQQAQSTSSKLASSLMRVRSRFAKSVGAAQKPGRSPRKRVVKGELKKEDDSPGAGSRRVDLRGSILASGLFDSDWYLQQYPDVSATGMAPLQHYMEFGGPELRDPNPYFDSRFFAAAVQLGAGENPLAHYLDADVDSRLPTSQWFDGARYARLNDVPSNEPALQHFVARAAAAAPFPMSLRRQSRKRVVFVSGESHTAGHRYRVEDFAAALPPARFDVFVTSLADYPTMTYAIRDADFVWAWRIPWNKSTRKIFAAARRNEATVVADIDDMIFSPDLVKSGQVDGVRSLHLETESFAKGALSRGRALAEADMRVATTDFLVGQIETEFGRAVEIPNGYDAESWSMSVKATEIQPLDGLIRIGYAGGSLTHQKDLQVAMPAICKVLRENAAARFVAFSGFLNIREFPDLIDCLDQVEWRDPVPVSRLALEYARFSINIAPLELGNPFCDAKSALKFHEAALVGVPTVASPTEPFRNVIRQGVNGYVATTEEDWYERLSELVNDPTKRAGVAAKARQDVIWNFGPSRRGLLIAAALEVAAGRMTVQQYKGVAPERVFDRFPEAELQSIVTHRLGSPGRVTCVVVLDDGYPGGVSGALSSLSEQSEADLDVVVVDARRRGVDSSLEEWIQASGDVFASLRVLVPQGNPTTSGMLNWVYTRSRTRSIVIVSADVVLGPDFVYELIQTQELTGAVAVLPGTHDRLEPVIRASDALLLSAEGWAAVGGFKPGKDAVFDLLERITSAGLPTRHVPSAQHAGVRNT